MVGSPCLAGALGLEEVPCRKVSLCWTVTLGQEKLPGQERGPCWVTSLVLKEAPGLERGPCWVGGPQHPAPSLPPRASLASHPPLAQTSCPAGSRCSAFLSSIKENSDFPSHFHPGRRRRAGGLRKRPRPLPAASPSACKEPRFSRRSVTCSHSHAGTHWPWLPCARPRGLGRPPKCRSGGRGSHR